MSDAYRLNLVQGESALNIVLGSALGAYIGVALSISPNDVNLFSFFVFLSLTYFFVKSLLSLQHYGREKYWQPFALIGITTVTLLFLAYKSSSKLPLDSSVFGVIAGLWLFSVFLDTGANLILERIVPKKKIEDRKTYD